ncbi:MAG: conserved rane protein of unknown function [Frankiales bacterium]|nr:conserved rane protein of unknown function [Frankiales bacterium]
MWPGVTLQWLARGHPQSRPHRTRRCLPPKVIPMASHTVIHLLHDLGAATWFGGSLMGATSLNAAAAQLDDPRQRAWAATRGWSRWAPVNAAGVAAHVVGATGLLLTDLPRVRTQQGVLRSSVVKGAVTTAALGTAAWSGALNRRMAAAGPVPVQGATEPAAATPPDVATTQQQLKVVQWLNPLLAGAVIATGAWQEEQQRTTQAVPGVLAGLRGRAPRALPALAVVGALAVAARRRRPSQPVVEAYPPPPVVERPTTITPVTPAAAGAADGRQTGADRLT